MIATVTSPYTDRVTGLAHLAGELVELGGDRYGELLRGGFVGPADGPADLSALTAAQLRDYIEARGGSCGRRDAKARLVEIARSL